MKSTIERVILEKLEDLLIGKIVMNYNDERMADIKIRIKSQKIGTV